MQVAGPVASEQIAATTLAGFGFVDGTSAAVAAGHHTLAAVASWVAWTDTSGMAAGQQFLPSIGVNRLERTKQAAALSEHDHLLTVRGSGHASGV